MVNPADNKYTSIALADLSKPNSHKVIDKKSTGGALKQFQRMNAILTEAKTKKLTLILTHQIETIKQEHEKIKEGFEKKARELNTLIVKICELVPFSKIAKIRAAHAELTKRLNDLDQQGSSFAINEASETPLGGDVNLKKTNEEKPSLWQKLFKELKENEQFKKAAQNPENSKTPPQIIEEVVPLADSQSNETRPLINLKKRASLELIKFFSTMIPDTQTSNDIGTPETHLKTLSFVEV